MSQAYANKEQTESNQRGGRRGTMGRGREGSSQGTFRKDSWPKTTDGEGRTECGRWRVTRPGERNGGNGDNCN